MRKTYKFSHSVVQGGYLYAHKTSRIIKNKEGLRNVLNAISKKFELIDATIKIYDSIFFFFFMTKPLVDQDELIKKIHSNLSSFGKWDKDYLYSTVYDLQEEYLRPYLRKLRFDYDKG